MRIARIILQALLGLAFMFFGFMKVSTPYADMITMEGMMWAQDYTATQVLIIGVVELIAGLATVLPLLLKRWSNLVPISTLAFMALMGGAAYTHIQRDEPIVINIVLFVVAALVFWLNRRQTGA